MSHSDTGTAIKRTLIILVILILGGYALFQARTFLEGPRIVIVEPRDGSVVEESPIDIVGYARNVSRIAFNGRAIVIDEEGRFRERLLLPEGYTILTLEAEDRFGRTARETVELVRTP